MGVREDFQREFGQTIEQAADQANREFRKWRAVSDAILLERAARVLERRDPDTALKFQLRAIANGYRQEAESGA